MPSHDIIDNRNRKLVDKINCILESSEAAHFAVGYFFISGFTAISDRPNNIKQPRNYRTNSIRIQKIKTN